MAQFLSAATKSKIELRRDRIISLTSEDDGTIDSRERRFNSLSTTPVALAAIQGAFRCVEVVGSPVDASVIESLSISVVDAGVGANRQQTAAGAPSVAWCGEQDGSITIRQLSNGQVQSRFPPTQRHTFPCSMVNVCNVEVWVGYSDGGLKIFSPQREKTALVEFRGHSTTVSALVFAALGVEYYGVQFVVSSSTDWTIIVWDARRDYSGQAPKAVSKVAIAKSPIKSLASGIFSPFLVSQQHQQQQQQQLRPFSSNNANSKLMMTMMMTADDRDRNLLCAGCGNGSVLVMELEPSRAVVNVLWETGGISSSSSTAFSSSSSTASGIDNNPTINAVTFFQASRGRYLVLSGSTNGHVIARNALDGSNPQLVERRPSAVLSVSADKASGLVWIGGSDGVITVYTNELKHLATLQHHGGAYVSSIKSFVGNASRRRVWVCGDDGELRCFLLASHLSETNYHNRANSSFDDDDDDRKLRGSLVNNNGGENGSSQAINGMLQQLRETILRNGAQLHLLRTAAWKLRRREQLCLESFCSKNLTASAFLGGPGWELVAMAIENVKMFRLKQRQYIISLQRASYGGFRASIHLGRRYFLKWIFFSSAQRYRASSLLVAQQFQNRHRFDIQARYLSRLWRETLRIERGQQLMNVAQVLNSNFSKGTLRTAFRRWLQWLATRRSFKSARKICAIIGKQTDNAILATYWNALVHATQRIEKMKKFAAAASAISRLTTTSLTRTMYEKWKKWRALQFQTSTLDQTMDTRGMSRNREVLSRYFRRWSEYFTTMECQRMEEELARKKKEQEEWEQMIVCDKAKMQAELAQRKPALQAKLDDADAELRELEAKLHYQESYHAALQREALFINEDLPIDPNAPIHEQVACVIEFLKARCIHCLYDIKVVGELNKKAIASLAAPPRVPGGPPPVAPPIDTPFGAALYNAKLTFNSYSRSQGMISMKHPSLTGYTPPASDDDQHQHQPPKPKTTATTAATTTPPPRPSTPTTPSARAKPGAKSSFADGAAKKNAEQTKEDRLREARAKDEAAAKALLAKRRAASAARAARNGASTLPGGSGLFGSLIAHKKVEIPEPYKMYWAVPVDDLPDARRSEMEKMILVAKQLIVGFDTVSARSVLAQRQLNYSTPISKQTQPQQQQQEKPLPIRNEWLQEFLVNAHILLKVAIEEYRKRQRQGIETGGIDDLDLARSQSNPSALRVASARPSPPPPLRRTATANVTTATTTSAAVAAASSARGTPTKKRPLSTTTAATSSSTTATRPAGKPVGLKTTLTPRPADAKAVTVPKSPSIVAAPRVKTPVSSSALAPKPKTSSSSSTTTTPAPASPASSTITPRPKTSMATRTATPPVSRTSVRPGGKL